MLTPCPDTAFLVLRLRPAVGPLQQRFEEKFVNTNWPVELVATDLVRHFRSDNQWCDEEWRIYRGKQFNITMLRGQVSGAQFRRIVRRSWVATSEVPVSNTGRLTIVRDGASSDHVVDAGDLIMARLDIDIIDFRPPAGDSSVYESVVRACPGQQMALKMEFARAGLLRTYQPEPATLTAFAPTEQIHSPRSIVPCGFASTVSRPGKKVRLIRALRRAGFGVDPRRCGIIHHQGSPALLSAVLTSDTLNFEDSVRLIESIARRCEMLVTFFAPPLV